MITIVRLRKCSLLVGEMARSIFVNARLNFIMKSVGECSRIHLGYGRLCYFIWELVSGSAGEFIANVYLF